MGGTKKLWTRLNAITLQETGSNKERENSGTLELGGVSVASKSHDKTYDKCSGYRLYSTACMRTCMRPTVLLL